MKKQTKIWIGIGIGTTIGLILGLLGYNGYFSKRDSSVIKLPDNQKITMLTQLQANQIIKDYVDYFKKHSDDKDGIDSSAANSIIAPLKKYGYKVVGDTLADMKAVKI